MNLRKKRNPKRKRKKMGIMVFNIAQTMNKSSKLSNRNWYKMKNNHRTRKSNLIYHKNGSISSEKCFKIDRKSNNAIFDL